MTFKLNGINVLVTRPAHQAENLCRLIEAEGGQAVRLPTVEIAEINDKSTLLDCCARLQEFNIAIFISVNAVSKVLPVLLAQPIPAHLQFAAVGKRTAEVLSEGGLTVLCPDPPFNSESLLAMPQLQEVKGKKIIIFRGEGGRELLAEVLQERGAYVDYVEVYRRVQPGIPIWELPPIDIIIVTSVESLRNLFTMLKNQAWLMYTPLAVMSARIRAEAETLGIQAPIFIAPAANDEGLLNAALQAIIQLPPLP